MASGAARASTSRSGAYSEERLRNINPNGSFRSDRADPAHPDAQQPGMAHKRTASGNPRPPNYSSTTNHEERRYEERKVTERTFEAHVDRLLKRPSSPDKHHHRSATGEKRDAEAKPFEHRPKEQAPEIPLGNGTMVSRWPRQ